MNVMKLLVLGGFAVWVLLAAAAVVRDVWRARRSGGGPAAVVDEITVPLLDGSHEHLPADKASDDTFWALAKTAGIEVDQ